MKLGFEEAQASYESGSQNARAWTEHWVGREGFCPNCAHSSLTKFENNRPAADFFCPNCNEEFELKSQKRSFGKKVIDGAYRTMRERIVASNNPNFFLLNYDLDKRLVTNLLVIPKHFFVPEVLQQRPPLAMTARRAGWIGCNILLHQIPESGKIFIVKDGVLRSRESVISRWQNTLFLRDTEQKTKGWLLDVMRCVERVGKPEFELEEIYAFEKHLSDLHPANRNVRPKIRQQLQYLRNRGFLEFRARGTYRLTRVGQ